MPFRPRKADVLNLVDRAIMDLVGDDDEIVFGDEVGDTLQLLPDDDGTGRVIG